MANALYDYGRNGFLDGSIDWDTDDCRVILLATGYSVNLSTHQFVSDLVPGSNEVDRSAASLASKTATAGVANASNHTIASVSGSQITQFVIYKYNASDSAARLIAHIDTASSGLPVTPNGGDITINWDTGANKIFKL